jgi:two-component system, cell cycle sensor histidine kinase and response regulator CckA
MDDPFRVLIPEDDQRAGEAGFRSVYENALIGMYRTTPDGRILMANPAAVGMLGYASFEALAQRNIEQDVFAHAESLGAYRAQLDRDGVVQGLEGAWLRHDRSTFGVRVSAHVIRDAQGLANYIDGTFEDITAQQSMQEALHLTQFCVDHASVGIIRIGAHACILSANNEVCRLLGYTSAELCAMRIVDIDPNVSIEQWVIQREELRARGSKTFESTHRRKDGTLFPVEITNTYLEFQGNGFTITFVRDISDRKQAEDTHAQLEQQLLQFQKMESIGRLAGGVAHDFNNLLTVIQGYCDLMAEEIPSDSSLLEELGQIRQASQRAAALTRQLLAFGRKQILSPAVFSLNDLVRNVSRMLDRVIGEDIALVTALEPELRAVMADPGQIEQVIMNLVINARDAMPTGGTLMIETSNVELDPSYKTTHPEAPIGRCVLLSVTDTGVGMDELTQARIFEPFFTTKASSKGTGLGLATVYGIVKQSGGEITVASYPGHGTTFHILLPVSVEAGGERTDVQEYTVPTGGSETILLAEDDTLVRELARTVLRNAGYSVLEAAHGRDALTVAQQYAGPIDLLLADVVMPQMGGRELAEQLRQARPQIKVLFMSGYTDDAVVRHGLLMAKVDLLAKPFSPLKLAAKVREVLEKPHVAPSELPQPYYQGAHDVLKRTLETGQGAVNTRSFAHAMVAQGNVLAMMGDLGAAIDEIARGLAIFQALGDRTNQASLLERLGWMAREQGDAARAWAWLEDALALNRILGDHQQVAWTLLTMSGVAILREDAAGAEALIEQGRALSPDSHDWIGWCLNHLGHAAQLRREYGRAEQLHQQTLVVFVERLGDKSTGVMWAYQGLGETALGRGDATTARQWFHAAVQLSRDLGARIMIAWCLAGLGCAAALDEELERAVRLWGAAERERVVLGCRPAPAARATYERLRAQARAQLGEDAFAAAWAAGEALALEQVIAEALGDA